VKTGQHISQLKVRGRMGSLETYIVNPQHTPKTGGAIAMPNPIDDQATASGHSSETQYCLLYHFEPDGMTRHGGRKRAGFIPDHRMMDREDLFQGLEVGIPRTLTHLRPAKLAAPTQSAPELSIRSVETLG
jgi:hypothetical protein